MREIKLTIRCANLSTKASRRHSEEYESYLLRQVKLNYWSKFKLRQISRCHVCSCITRINWVLNRIPVEVAHWYFVYKGKKKKQYPHPPKKTHPSQANRNSIENLCMIQKCVIIQRFMTPLLYWLLCILLNW